MENLKNNEIIGGVFDNVSDNDLDYITFPNVDVGDRSYKFNKNEKITYEDIIDMLDNPYSFEEIRNININELGEFDSEGNFHLKNEFNNDFQIEDIQGLSDSGKPYSNSSDGEKYILVNNRAIFSAKEIRGYWQPAKNVTYYDYNKDGYKGEFTIYGNDGEHFFSVTFKSDGTRESFIGLNAGYYGTGDVTDKPRWVGDKYEEGRKDKPRGGTKYYDGDGEFIEVSQLYNTDHNTIKYRNGDVFEGELKKVEGRYLPEGKGKMTYVDGRVEEGIRENGKLAYKKVE